MKNARHLIGPVQWALSAGRLSADIARLLAESLALFAEDTNLFDSGSLRGPAKRAELVVKLGFWLVRGQLAEPEFRLWTECIPPEDNAGWDVDLLHAEPGSPIPPVLKMGPLYTHPEACLIQESRAACLPDP